MFNFSNIKIINKRKIWMAFSGTVIALGLIMMLINGGLNLSIDFLGGSMLQIDMKEAFDNDEVAAILDANDITGYEIRKAEGDTHAMIRTPELSNEQVIAIFDDLQEAFDLEDDALLNNTTNSSIIGQESTEKAIFASIVASILMFAYITFRFEFRFALSAILALIHDVLFVIAIFAIFNLTVDYSFVAAILTILGYSINNTIVIFDRIRENVRGMQRADTLEGTIDTSIGQSMTRSLNTALTTLLVLISLLILGGASIRGFVFALTAGVVIGTYSSICVAGSLYYLFKNKKAQK